MDRSEWSRAEGVDVPAGSRVLDLGCGNGALLRLLAARGPIEGTGVDLHAQGAAPSGVRLVEADADTFAADAAGYDLVCSVAAVTPLARLAGLVRPGGLVLFGEGYWKRPPTDRYLEALGASRDELMTRDETERLGEGLGLTPIRSIASSQEQWDRYESTWAANGEAHAAAHAGEPGVAEFLAWIRAGRCRYLELGGRETLGFLLVLLRAPL